MNKSIWEMKNSIMLCIYFQNKLHEDEMLAMERRLENLTEIVHKLTTSFDNLNRQVRNHYVSVCPTYFSGWTIPTYSH